MDRDEILLEGLSGIWTIKYGHIRKEKHDPSASDKCP